MGEEETAEPAPLSEPQPEHQPEPEQLVPSKPDSSPSSLEFDPSRMIGIIRRKALIKDLAAVYHAECLNYCQELLSYQRKWEETYNAVKPSEDLRRDNVRAAKRAKKVR